MIPLEKKISDRSARIGVMGLGYVGLPLAVAFAKAGFKVSGHDVDPKKCRSLLDWVRADLMAATADQVARRTHDLEKAR